MRVLVGDIGGTKTRLALATVTGDRVELSATRRYSSADAPDLATIVRRYLAQTAITCDAASLAIAGPIHGDRCKTTNLPWEIDARELERTLGIPRVRLLNDLEAVAWAVGKLEPAQLGILHEPEFASDPESPVGNAVVIAAGTGLGVAGLYWDGQRHHPFATEAGHADFAAVDEREIALLRHLKRRYAHVSWERVVSGQGIVNVYEFLLDWRGGRPLESSGESTAAAIAEAAARGSCSICVETMDLFARLYGRVCGDLALSHMAIGGVYLAGGVTQANLELLHRGPFLAAMFAKGRMTPLVRGMPVRVISEPTVALVGAARFLIAT